MNTGGDPDHRQSSTQPAGMAAAIRAALEPERRVRTACWSHLAAVTDRCGHHYPGYIMARSAAVIVNAGFWGFLVVTTASHGRILWAAGLALAGLFTIAPTKLLWGVFGNPYLKSEQRQMREARAVLLGLAVCGLGIAVLGVFRLVHHGNYGVALIIAGLTAAILWLAAFVKLPARVRASRADGA